MKILYSHAFLNEAETVKVHDIVYIKLSGERNLYRGFYRKLRLSKDWVDRKLSDSGFSKIDSKVENGFVTVVATK